MSSLVQSSSSAHSMSDQVAKNHLSSQNSNKSVVNAKRHPLETCLLITALAASAFATLTFALLTGAAIAAAITAGASGIAASGIVPSAITALFFGSMCAVSGGLTFYLFQKL